MGEVVRLEEQRSIDVLATRINEEHRACERAVVSAVEHAIRAGEMLLEAKERAGHGNWGDWLRQHFEGSERHAQRYMHIARRKDELNPTRVSDLSIRGALRELSPGSTESDRGDVALPDNYKWNVPLITDPEFVSMKGTSPTFLGDLEDSIRLVGLIEPIIAWRQTRIILDGNARYRVCVSAGLPYLVKFLDLEDRLDAELVVIDTNLYPPRLTEWERSRLVAEREKVITAMGRRT